MAVNFAKLPELLEVSAALPLRLLTHNGLMLRSCTDRLLLPQ
jgi:hypothetical protein